MLRTNGSEDFAPLACPELVEGLRTNGDEGFGNRSP